MSGDAPPSVCVVGAGAMGAQIAHQAALHGCRSVLVGRSAERLAAACEETQSLLRRRVEKGKLSDQECSEALARVSTTCNLEEGVAGSDVVVESVAEDRDVKRAVLQRIGAYARDDAIIGSNSSTIPTSTFADDVLNPARLLNVHFFNPAMVMALVEVVPGPHTASWASDRAMAFAAAIGKSPVLVQRESFGFLGNRMLFAAIAEAMRLAEGRYVSVEDCDSAVRSALGWTMGPFAIADLVGLDVVEAILDEGFRETGDPQWVAPQSLRDRVAAGDLGRKTASGFAISVPAKA